MSHRVGGHGSVLAIDINTRFLNHLGPPITVKGVDLVNDDIGSAAFEPGSRTSGRTG
jgi:hypothetical protein